MFENQLVTKLHTTKVNDGILHRLLYETAFAGLFSLQQGCQQADKQVHTGVTVTKCSTRLGWNIVLTLVPSGSSSCTSGTLSHRFESLHAGKWRIVIKALDGTINHSRIDFMHIFPRESQLVHGSRMQVFYKNIGCLQQSGQYFFSFGRFHIQFDGTLVAVQLQVIQAIHIRIIQQFCTGRVAQSLAFYLDDIGSQPCQHLRTRWTRLYLSPVNHSNSF